MAKTRQVQWEQQKLQQMMMESDLDAEATIGTPRSAANIGTPRSFVGNPRSFNAPTTRSSGFDAPVSNTSMNAPISNGNMRNSPVRLFIFSKVNEQARIAHGPIPSCFQKNTMHTYRLYAAQVMVRPNWSTCCTVRPAREFHSDM